MDYLTRVFCFAYISASLRSPSPLLVSVKMAVWLAIAEMTQPSEGVSPQSPG
jgi:hypothetical protein